jgi:hypothetical protein
MFRKKAITFKTAAIIVVALHIAGFAGLHGLASYKSSKRKQELAEKKQQMLNAPPSSSKDWPTTATTTKPKVTEVPKEVVQQLKEQSKARQLEEIVKEFEKEEQKTENSFNKVVPMVTAALPKVVPMVTAALPKVDDSKLKNAFLATRQSNTRPTERKVTYTSHKKNDEYIVQKSVKEVNKFIVNAIPSEKEIVKQLDYYQTQFDTAKEIVLEEITTRVVSSRPVLQ